jgi:hypothetical protein
MTLREYDALNRKFDRARKNLDATFDIQNSKRRLTALNRRGDQLLAVMGEMAEQSQQRVREALRPKKRSAKVEV